MNVYTIVLERIGTGEPSLSIVTRQDNEEAARAYAEAAIAQSPDLRVVVIHARPDDPSASSAGWHRATWLMNRKQPGLEQNSTSE
jgi:hypothetical protein